MDKNDIIPFVLDGKIIGWQTQEDAAIMKEVCKQWQEEINEKIIYAKFKKPL